MGVSVGGLSNSQTAELLALEAEKVSGQLRMAFRRAARLSCIWPVEIVDLLAHSKPLTILPGIGPFLETRIRGWLEAGTPAPEPPQIRRGFLTVPQARAILARHPAWRAAYKGDLQ